MATMTEQQLERINNATSLEALWHGCLENERENLKHATAIVIALRRKLRDQDPSLPNPHDGNNWATIEADWLNP